MTLEEIQTLMRTALARGNSQDANFIPWLKLGGSWLERNTLFMFMQAELSLTLTAGTNIIVNANNRLRSIDSVWSEEADADTGDIQRLYLPQVNVNTVASIDREAQPSGYYTRGQDLVFDAEPIDDITYNAFVYRYTDLSGDIPADYWFLSNAADLFLYSGLRQAAIFLKDSQLRAAYQEEFQTALRTITTSEREAIDANRIDFARFNGNQLRQQSITQIVSRNRENDALTPRS